MAAEYSKWKAFAEGKTPGTTPLPESLSKYVSPQYDHLVLDLGCAWGRVSSWLYLEGYSVIGTDINEHEIETAQKGVAQILDSNEVHTLRFQVDDAAKHIDLPDKSVDAVTINAVLVAMTTLE